MPHRKAPSSKLEEKYSLQKCEGFLCIVFVYGVYIDSRYMEFGTRRHFARAGTRKLVN